MTSVCLIQSGIFLVDLLVQWIIAASENDFCRVFFLICTHAAPCHGFQRNSALMYTQHCFVFLARELRRHSIFYFPLTPTRTPGPPTLQIKHWIKQHIREEEGLK